jgi:hypothetical protein
MATSFELRSTRAIAAAYALAPLAGLAALLLAFAVSAPHPERTLAEWPAALVFGGAVCLIIELVVVTPLLLGYRAHRWRWLNGWTGVALGFVVGVLASGTLAVLIFSDSGVYGYGPHNEVLVANGAWTPAGLRVGAVGLAIFAPQFGLGGAVAALVLRLMAVRAVPAPGATAPSAPG